MILMEAPIYIRPTAATRNAPCTCGSGKKLKKCCGSAEKHNAFNAWCDEQQRLAIEARYQERLKEQQEYLAKAQERAAQGLPTQRRRMGQPALIGMLAGMAAMGAHYPLGAEIVGRNPRK